MKGLSNQLLPLCFFCFVFQICFHTCPQVEGDKCDIIFNRPGVGGTVLRTPLSLINGLTKSSFLQMLPVHLHSQTVSARELKFLEKVHLPLSCVICPLIWDMCPMSCVTFFFFLFYNVVTLVGSVLVINGATLSSLVKTQIYHENHILNPNVDLLWKRKNCRKVPETWKVSTGTFTALAFLSSKSSSTLPNSTYPCLLFVF